jgi:hypothetical protein
MQNANNVTTTTTSAVAELSSRYSAQAIAELMDRYNEYRAKFEARFGAEFDEVTFHAWFTAQVVGEGVE